MWPYIGLFLLIASIALTVNQITPVLQSSQPALPLLQRLRVLRIWGPMWVLLTLMVGLRHEVGGDWNVYQMHLDTAPNLLSAAMLENDPAYGLLNWIAAEFDLGVYFVNSVCAALFAWGLVAFCRRQPLPWLAMVVAVPYLIIVVAMGYTRQGVAIGLAMLGLVALDQRRVARFMVWIAFAAIFHKSAVILMPLALLVSAQRRLWVLLLAGLATFLLFILLLEQSVETLRVNYLEDAYESSGTTIRVAMNVVPAVLFLLLRKRFHLLPAQRALWTWIAFGAIAVVGLLYVSPSSTAVDRVALYFIPLQLFIMSRLPAAMGLADQANPSVIHAVVAYSVLVLLVWLFFAEHAFAWLPYQFYPWVLWQQ